MIYTIGHSVIPALDLVGALDLNGVKSVVDVRSKPFSYRNPQFSRGPLSDLLIQHNIAYRWLGKSLGGKDEVPVTSDLFRDGIKIVLELEAQYGTVALMCSEAHPKDCHRAMKLSAYLLRNHKSEVYHITPTDLIEAQEFETTQKADWLWCDFGGKNGAQP